MVKVLCHPLRPVPSHHCTKDYGNSSRIYHWMVSRVQLLISNYGVRINKYMDFFA